MSGSPVERGDFAFFCTSVDQLQDERRRFQLGPDDFALMNPNTRTCPVFRTRADADLTRAIYRRVPVLVDERTGANPWGVEFLRMFDMSNDSGLFRDAPGPGLVPLYEGKMLQGYDHRAASVETVLTNLKRPGQARPLGQSERRDPAFSPKPQYWVSLHAVEQRLGPASYFLALKSVTSPTNERTVIAAILPRVGAAHSIACIRLGQTSNQEAAAIVLANLNSVILDYVAKQKVGGVNLSLYYVTQFPLIPPSAIEDSEIDFIVPRVLELIYTAHDVASFARDCGYDGPPFPWDEERRALLRAELDAYYAALYGLTRDELRYILDPQDVYGPDFPGETFRVLKERETRQYGEYRTRRLVLEAWDRLGLEPRNRADDHGDGTLAPVDAERPTPPAPVTQRHDPSPSTPADGERLRHAIESTFPYPIARAFYQFRGIDDWRAEIPKLADVLGITLEHLAIVALSEYLAGDARHIELSERLRQQLQKPLSHGQWLGTLRDVLAFLSKQPGDRFAPELFDAYYRQPGDAQATTLGALGDELVEMRNELIKRNADALATPQGHATFKRRLLDYLRGAAFLKDYPLVSPKSCRTVEGLKTHTCALLQGFHDSFATMEVQTDLDLDEYRVAMLNARTTELLYLHPFYTVRRCPEPSCGQLHLFRFERIEKGRVEYAATGGHRYADQLAAAELLRALQRPFPQPLRRRARHLYVESQEERQLLASGYRVARKYEIVTHLRRGGMADVYVTRPVGATNGGQLALKLLPFQLLSDRVAVHRFREEAAKVRELDHPNVIRMVDYGEDLIDRYLVMELADGWPVEGGRVALDVGELSKPVPESTAIAIARQACEGLDFIHQRGIVHRDVKPGNLLLFSGDRVKLADFGLARAREAVALTMTGITVGTPAYVSPEQAEGKRDLTPASDLYSLGVVLFELLTGASPFQRSTPLATLHAHVHDKAGSIRKRNPSVSETLDRVVQRCLVKDVNSRVQSARELYEALGQCM